MSEPVPQAFDEVAEQYQQKALVQYKAAQRLLARVPLQGQEDILDLGCGPGHIADVLSSLTRGRVVGSDVSSGMIAEARAQYPRVKFQQADVLDINYEQAFDLVFCNSAFQWFRDPARAVEVMRRALRPGGRVAMSCPMAWETFEEVIQEVGQHPDIRPIYAHWVDPWVRLAQSEMYRGLFEQAGFQTLVSEGVRESSWLLMDQAYQVYLSGASNGYTSQGFYTVPISETYVQTFNRLVRTGLESRLQGLKLEVVFQRVYYVGKI